MANNEWRTPLHIIESARLVMGSIDVDPASSDEANKSINAKVYYTKDRCGIDEEWVGNVWLNPPYGRGEAEPFLSSLTYQYNLKIVKQAIVLLNTVYTSNWWKHSGMNSIHSALCLPDNRIQFIDPKTNEPATGKNPRDQMIVYIGESPERFCDVFNQYGMCYLPNRISFL